MARKIILERRKLLKGYEFGDVLLGGYAGDEASRKSEDKDEEVMLLSAVTEIRDQGRRDSRNSKKSALMLTSDSRSGTVNRIFDLTLNEELEMSQFTIPSCVRPRTRT